MPSFKDKVIVVTGASEGIGRALCLALAHRKPKLVLAARNEARLDALRDEVEALGARALVAVTDISQEAQCRALILKTVDAFGRLDVLVNNAGMTMWSPLADLADTAILERIMRTNYFGAAWSTYYALPYLLNSKGRIVVLSSVAGMGGVPTRTGYSASKHALFGFFDSLRIELMGTGVSVTMVAPDFVLSQIHRRALGPDGQPLGKSPLQEDRIMTAETCAFAIVNAMVRRKRLLVPSWRGQLGRWLKLIWPSLVDRIARKAIREAR